MITSTIYKSALDDTKETQRIENPITIKELYPDVDFTNSIISVNGFRQDENYLLQDDDVCTIRIFPEGDAKDWVVGAVIGLVAGIAAVALAPVSLVAGAIILGAGIAGGAVGFGIASAAGWSVTSWLGSLANVDQGNVGKSPLSLEQIPQLRGAKNQSAYGQPVPLVLGKHFFTPGYVGRPYTQISGVDGEDQYFYALYLLGYGKLKVTDVKLGLIGDLASNYKNGTTIDDGNLVIDGDSFILEENPRVELIQSARESVIYPQAVVEEQLSIELYNPVDSNPLNVTRFTAKNPMKVQIEITLPSGLVAYGNDGSKGAASIQISARWRRSRPDNSDNWKEFAQFGVGQSQGLLVIGDTYVPSISYGVTGNSIDFNPTTTIYRAKSKVMRFIAEKTFYSYSEVSDTYDTRVIEVEIIRVDKQSDSSQVIDKVYLTAIRTWLFDNEKSKGGTLVAQVPVIQKLRDKTARLGFRIKATQNTQGMLDALNCIVESKCRTWDSGTKTWGASDWDIANQQWTGNTETPSNNPAALALKLLQSPTLGRKAYPDSMLDMDSFGEFYEWCEESKYTCNGVLTQGKRTDEVLALILATGRAMRILNGSKYGLLIDKPRDYPVMIINSQNVLEASNQKAFADLPNGFLIKFVNEDDGYQQTEIYVMADGTNRPKDESVIENLELPYVTNRAQAIRIGWYMLACRLLRPEVWNRKLSVDGYLIGIGDLVEVQDDTIVVGIGEGAAVTGLVRDENGLVSEIQTDGQFDVSDMTKQYGIKIMQADGIHDIAVRTLQVHIPEPGTYSNFTFNPPIELSFTPQMGDIVAFGEYEKITTPALCFGKKDNGDGTFDVTLVPYHEGIYTTDSGIIPPYEANITTPQAPYYPEEEPEEIKKSDIIDTIIESEIIVNDYIYSLLLTTQSHVLGCDHDGKVLTGELPFTTRAVLYRGEREVVLRSGIIKYPGTDGNLFDPMPGDFVPVDYDVNFFLIDPPEGVTIDKNGLITVSESAVLESDNYIVVRASYNSLIYTTKLYIKKGGGVYTPKYLGVTYTPTGTQTVEITIGQNVRLVLAHEGDWVAFLGETPEGSIWVKGLCMRWNGTQWEAVPVDASGSFESNPYMAALMDLTEGAPMGTFMSILVRDLVAKTAMIERIFTHKMKVQKIDNDEGAIYGGGYDENGNPTGGPGFFLGTDGVLKAVSGTFKGRIEADSGYFRGDIFAEDGYFKGEINNPVLTVSTQQIPGASLTYNSGVYVSDIMRAEFARFGLSAGVAPTNLTKNVSGTYNGKNIIRYDMYDQGRAGVVDISGITLFYDDGTDSGQLKSSSKLAYTLQFQYESDPSNTAWQVILKNIPTSDPRITGMVWRNGTDLMISNG